MDTQHQAGIEEHQEPEDVVETRSTLETRMERVEAMLETLIGRQDTSLRASAEPEGEQRAQETSGFQGRTLITGAISTANLLIGDTGFQAPIDTFNANLAPVRLQLGISEASTPATVAISNAAPSPLGMSSHVRIEGRKHPFPSQGEYDSYLKFFFDDINPCHLCVNEADFRIRSERLVTSLRGGGRFDRVLLALHYIMFSLGDILRDVSPPGSVRRLPGWKWYLAAEALVGKRKSCGRANLTLIQFLIFEVRFRTSES